eukprot:CAMPEP_0118895504 /NCGR_PEP_ID=MMETSP1166-20130328/3831_1 /TAXON_ID=1104430 /ORGANISM="Chrysoreinhardia sp, Strain CCMP3193" /LENGTH=46 /DNA_ID= /DNA_START= /DNA_END= /DNA_ORIENTATION=
MTTQATLSPRTEAGGEKHATPNTRSIRLTSLEHCDQNSTNQADSLR